MVIAFINSNPEFVADRLRNDLRTQAFGFVAATAVQVRSDSFRPLASAPRLAIGHSAYIIRFGDCLMSLPAILFARVRVDGCACTSPLQGMMFNAFA